MIPEKKYIYRIAKVRVNIFARLTWLCEQKDLPSTKARRLHEEKALRGKGICVCSKVFPFAHSLFREGVADPISQIILRKLRRENTQSQM